MHTFFSASSVRDEADRILLESAKLKTRPWNMAASLGWRPICYWGFPGDPCSMVIPSGHNNTPTYSYRERDLVRRLYVSLEHLQARRHMDRNKWEVSQWKQLEVSLTDAGISALEGTQAAADSLQRNGLKKTHLCKNKEKPNRVQLPSSQ